MTFVAYAILDNTGNVAYIGQTNDIKRRQSEHKRDYRKPLYDFVNSLNNFQLLPLAYANTRQEILERESYLIDFYLASGCNLKNSLLVTNGKGLQ